MKMLNGPKVKALRRERGLEAQQVADALGWKSPQTVYLYERGYRPVEADVLFKLAALLGVRPEDLLIEVELKH